MSLLKLVVYGGLGYLTYQMFFADLEPGQVKQGRSEKRPPQRAQKPRQASGSPRGQQLTGGGEGMEVTTKEPGGTSTPHRVGRGVI